MVVNLLSGESRWNGLATLQEAGVGDGMLMGRRPKPTPRTQSREGINTLVMGSKWPCVGGRIGMHFTLVRHAASNSKASSFFLAQLLFKTGWMGGWILAKKQGKSVGESCLD